MNHDKKIAILWFMLGLFIGMLLGPIAHGFLVVILGWLGQKPI